MRDIDPAIPPERMLVPNLTYWGASLLVLKTALMVSLKAKLRACVGKYLKTLAKLPEIGLKTIRIVANLLNKFLIVKPSKKVFIQLLFLYDPNKIRILTR